MNPTIDIQKSLIDACKKGNENAQFEIYKLYSKAIYCICLRIVASSAEAEELMQDVFFKSFTKISSFKGEQTFGAWLKRIAINQAIDHVRKKKIKWIEIDKIENTLANDTFIDEVEFANRMNEVNAKILELDTGYRMVLSLNLIDGLNHDEIGKLLGISASTSRSQLARAKKKLIELLVTH